MREQSTAETIRDLRNRTGAGMIEARKAMKDADYDADLAEGILKYRGCAVAIRGMTKDEWVMINARRWADEKRSQK